ncbi:hypothetical protein Pmar_PMAR008886 [Perkinsus marinus ATCC 50983]|uniref:Reverse transcriptase domain-containing protein n=1 Tax=Perkinsus marinus (strain ATCC 50983 / TXsc) TaxID=423536 RepID=C5KA96_PERM5|nr:hypothetical protein Pmar_PMAR008886 [Perkinsus marinus ATCC 50983]EER18557.1 hypothetical protein Pmar_PMAR008886 [Perkinsus marinus ATCC 50983]|eukprot:XP_002786761.1 hypothetical protein Pmar_PMAR008886 [Perkinsus marinus ATCC 50983]
MMRPRKVRIATSCGISEPFIVSRSVPQGSVLACSIFNLSMEVCNTKLAIGSPTLAPKVSLPNGDLKVINHLLFADDQTVLVQGRGLPKCVGELNARLENAATWAVETKNEYAPEKSLVVPLGTRLRQTSNFAFNLNGQDISVAFDFLYLGVPVTSSKRNLWVPLHRKSRAIAAISSALSVYRTMAPLFIIRLVVAVGWSALLYGHDLAFPKPQSLDICCNTLVKIGLGLPGWTPTAFLYVALQVPVASALHLKRALICWNTIYNCDHIHKSLIVMVMSDPVNEMWRGFVAFAGSIGVSCSLMVDCITSHPAIAKHKAYDIFLLASAKVTTDALGRALRCLYIGIDYVECCGTLIPLPLPSSVMSHQEGRAAIRALIPLSFKRCHCCSLCGRSTDSVDHLLLSCPAGPNMSTQQVYDAFTSPRASSLLSTIASVLLKRNSAVSKLLRDKEVSYTIVTDE